MIQDLVAKRYARALIELAEESQGIDTLGTELKNVLKLFNDNKELSFVLSTKGVAVVSRINILEKIAAKVSLSQVVLNFLKLLVRKGRVDIFENIVAQYAILADQRQGRQKMQVMSAVELAESVYSDLAAHFENKLSKKMIIEKRIEPDVLGGVCVRIGDQVFDYTLASQIKNMKSAVLNDPVN
ncbi:MAG: ATP synthase F1 subunit delta [Deltaproteobacteria bacterium]|nr:ATP synthase F1 subunit delta [Deltaproteobacteria bacterium]